MDFHDTIIEFFLYHGIARVHRGFGDTVELAGRFLDTDRETLPSAILEETARRRGLTREGLDDELRRFARYIGQKNGRLYEELVGGGSGRRSSSPPWRRRPLRFIGSGTPCCPPAGREKSGKISAPALDKGRGA